MIDYDGPWKRLFHNFTEEALSLLCGVDTRDCKITELPTEHSRSVRADLVYEVVSPDGEPTIMHVEVQSQHDPDFDWRMVLYWAMLTGSHRRAPRQVVILPKGGAWCTGLYRFGRLSLGYDVVDATALDAETLLRTDLAPLALATSPDPRKLIDRVTTRIGRPALSKDQRRALFEMAILAGGPGLLHLIVASLRRHGMSDLLEEIPEVQALAKRAEAEGEARGEARGELKGRAEFIRTLLADRFGERDDIDAVAQHLAVGDPVTVLHRIHDATTLDELRPRR